MKIWSTRYCLTDGITKHEVSINEAGVAIIPPSQMGSFYPTYLYEEGKQWHRSRDAAVTRANEVKIKKLQSLNKQVKRISAIEFD